MFQKEANFKAHTVKAKPQKGYVIMAAAWNHVAVSWELKIGFIKLNTQVYLFNDELAKILFWKVEKFLNIYNAIIETNKNSLYQGLDMLILVAISFRLGTNLYQSYFKPCVKIHKTSYANL